MNRFSSSAPITLLCLVVLLASTTSGLRSRQSAWPAVPVTIEQQADITRRSEPVRASLPLAAGLEPRLEENCARVALASGQVLCIELAAGLAWRIERAACYPRFGEEVDRPVLVGEASRFESGTTRFYLER